MLTEQVGLAWMGGRQRVLGAIQSEGFQLHLSPVLVRNVSLPVRAGRAQELCVWPDFAAMLGGERAAPSSGDQGLKPLQRFLQGSGKNPRQGLENQTEQIQTPTFALASSVVPPMVCPVTRLQAPSQGPAPGLLPGTHCGTGSYANAKEIKGVSNDRQFIFHILSGEE